MFTLCVLGKTGVGKSEAAETIARVLDGEIINLDMGQMYTKIAIGTAKPLWKEHDIPHHLFDIVDEPKDCTVAGYRKEVIKKINVIHAKRKNAILVGGSLFYMQSLLFKLHDEPVNNKIIVEGSWDTLHAIDPERAKAIHHKDEYRIKRALAIWHSTGNKPSEYKPFWDPIGKNIKLLWLYREKEDIRTRIEKRVACMVQQGWLDEVKNLDEHWKSFVHKKKLCGYNMVVDACRKNKYHLDDGDILNIQKETLAYAKKQNIFWAGLKKKCLPYEGKGIVLKELNLTFHSIDLYLEQMLVDKGPKDGQP